MVQLNVKERTEFGTKPAKLLRKEGYSTGVLYSPKTDNVDFYFDRLSFAKQYNLRSYDAEVVEIIVEDKKYLSVLQAIQVHPLSDRLLHADFKLVENGVRTKVLIPIKVTNKILCVGIKKGGRLNIVYRFAEVLSAPENIPKLIEIDIAPMDIGSKIRFTDIELPEGVDFTVKNLLNTVLNITGRAAKGVGGDEAEENQAQQVEDSSGDDKSEPAKS